MRTRTSIRTFTLRISDPSIPRTFVLEEQLEKEILFIQGLTINSTTNNGRAFILNGWTVMGLSLDNQELFPENTSASFFGCIGAVEFAHKFFFFLDRDNKRTPEPVKLGRLEFRYAHRPSEQEIENGRIYRLAQDALLNAVAAVAPAALPDAQRLPLERAVSDARRNVVLDYDVQLVLLVAVNA